MSNPTYPKELDYQLQLLTKQLETISSLDPCPVVDPTDCTFGPRRLQCIGCMARLALARIESLSRILAEENHSRTACQVG